MSALALVVTAGKIHDQYKTWFKLLHRFLDTCGDFQPTQVDAFSTSSTTCRI